MKKKSGIKEVIILAGGFGTRLQKVVKDVPKPMAEINGRPFLSYLLDYYEKQGVEHIILSIGYLGKVIRDYFGEKFGKMTLSYALEEKPLGTGGAIIHSLRYAQHDLVMVVNGDTMFKIKFEEVYQFHLKKQSDFTMVIRQVEDVSRYGSVFLSEEGRIVGFAEKNSHSGAGYINGGVYLLNKNLLTTRSFPEKFSIEKDFFEKEYNHYNMFGKVCNGYFIDIGIPEDYQKAQIDFAKGI